MRYVSVKIELVDWSGEQQSATIYVRLRDTSRIDARALTVAEVILHDVDLNAVQSAAAPVVRLSVAEVDPRAHYTVGVHVDLSGDAKPSVGDYINVRSYPVLTHGYPDHVEVQVCRIGNRTSCAE